MIAPGKTKAGLNKITAPNFASIDRFISVNLPIPKVIGPSTSGGIRCHLSTRGKEKITGLFSYLEWLGR